MEDKQIYTTARSEEIKRQIKAFSQKVGEKLEKFREKSKERQKSEKSDKKKSFAPLPKPKEKKAQNISVSSIEPQTIEKEEDTFYRKYVERKSKTDLNERLGIYSIFIYTIFLVIIIIIVFSIYVTMPGK